MTCRAHPCYDSYMTCSSIHTLCSHLPPAAKWYNITIMKGAGGDGGDCLIMGTYSMKGEFDFSNQMFTFCFVDPHVQLVIHVFNVTTVLMNLITYVLHKINIKVVYIFSLKRCRCACTVLVSMCLQVEGLVPFRTRGLGTRECLCHTLAANLHHHIALCWGNLLTSLN